MESVCVAIVATALKRFQEVKQTIETNQKKVFTTVVTKLLEPLLTLRSLILTQTSEDDAVRSQIKRYIEDIVLHSLFHPDHLFEYSLAFSLKQNVVTPAPSAEGGETKKPGRGKNRQSGGAYVGTISNYRKQLFDTLREYSGQASDKQKQSLLPPAHRLLVLQNIPLIYKGFLDTLKALLLAIEHSQEKRAERKDAGAADQSMDVAEEEDKKPRQYMDFHFLLELHDIIAPLLSLQSDAGNAAELATTVRIVSELMRLVEAYHVYEPTQDTDDRAHFHFLERLAHHDVGLLKQLFAHLQAHPARFDRAHQDLVGALFADLQHLGGLSHLTLSEPIKDVWTILWNLPWPSAEAVPAACVEFSRAQLATYSKLRQLDVLLEQLLPSFVAHSGGHAHYIISSRQFTKQFYDCVMQLPMGKIASIWEIFLKEIRTTYAERLHELLPAAQQKGERGAEATRVAGPLLVSLSYVVHLFVALIDSVLLVNTTAPMVLDLVSETCAELVSPLLVLAVGDRSGLAATKAKSPARKGGADGLTASLVRDALNVYNSLIGLREQCHRFPSTRVVAGGKKGSAKAAKNAASGHTVSDDVRANGSCFYLLPAKELNALPLSTLQEWLKPELQQFPQLRFVLNVLRIQHLRRLHTFASLYALRDQPSAASAREPAKEADAQIATLLQELRRAMEGASAGLFHELDLALPPTNDTGAAAAHWNGMMASISGATYAVALWKLVAENVDILSLYAAEEHLRLFLRVLLVDSTPSVRSTATADDSRGMITLELVSCALLSKTSFYELPRLANSCAPVLVGAIETTLRHTIPNLAKDTQLAGAVKLLRAMREATEEDESDIARQFAALFADAAHRSRASAQGGRFEPALARAGLLKLRDVLELVLALPSTYLAQEAKERSSTAVLVLDWVLHALLPAAHNDNAMQADNEECEESVQQAALAVSSTCRRYLAAMLRTPRPETTVLSNAVVSWLHSSLRGLEKMRPLLTHTLDVVAIHIRNELRRPERARREKLEEVLASVADSIAAEEEEEEGMTTDGLQEIRKVLLPLGCITNAVKALVDEYSERLGTPEQRKRLKHASLIEGNGQSKQQQPGMVIEDTCVVFVDRAEELLLRLLDEQPLSAYLSLSASTVDTLLRSSDRDLQTTAQDYFGHLLALMEQVLAFRHIESFRRTTARQQQQPQREARTRTVFSEIGRFASLAFQVLAAGATHERSGNEEVLRGKALRFVEYLCRNMHSLEPQPGRATFARFFAMLSHLMQLYTTASGPAGLAEFAKKVEACYIDLLCNSPAPYVALVAQALPTELASAQLPRLIATANTTLTLFAMNESRVLREFEGVAPTIVHKLVDLIGWCGLQLTPTTSAARGADLVHLISTALTIITHIITNRLFKIDTHTISRVLGAMSVFSVPRRRWAFAELELAHVHPAVRQQAKKKAPVTDFLPERLFLSFYSFLYRLLKIRYKQTFNCMPLFLLNIRDLLSSVFMAEQSALQSGRGTSGRAAATERSGGGGGGGHQQVACTENLARLLEEMSKHPKQFNKYVAQLLVQYIQLTEVNPLSPATKQALLPGIYALLDICSEFEYKVISRQVDETGRAIFKKLFEEYHRDWKFQAHNRIRSPR